MTKWLERQEKVHQRDTFVAQRQQGHQLSSPARINIGPPSACPQKVKMARMPERRQVLFDRLARDYGALDFQDMLAEFIAQLNHPGVSGGALQDYAHDTHIPFTRVPVFHKIKFIKSGNLNESEIADVVHIRPEQKDSHGRIIPARFDTVLVETSKGQLDLVIFILVTDSYSGRRIAQVRVVFQIPSRVVDMVFPLLDNPPPNHLAYVEWFSPIPPRPDPKHLMYRLSRLVRNGRRSVSIISVDSIICSVHLLPRFGGLSTPPEWNHFTVLEQCQSFYINPFTDMYRYLTFV